MKSATIHADDLTLDRPHRCSMLTLKVDMSQNPVIGPLMQSWDQAFVAAAYSAALVLYCLLTLQHT